MSNEKMHWHLVSYQYFRDNCNGHGSFRVHDDTRYPFKKKGLEELVEAIKFGDKDLSPINKVIITAISYLGHFTEEEFNRE